MKEAPLVTIVIPTYSRPIYLERSIKSVLLQTYKNIEVIVVDDNNPDSDARFETEKVMANYENNSTVIYIKHEKNKNGSAARNTGWRASHGEYITFLDDDDEIEPTKIEKQVQCLESLDCTWGACYTRYKIIKEHGKNQISSENRSGNCYVYALMRTMFMGSGSNLFLRKKVVDEINGYDETFQRNQDIEFMARALERYKLAYIDDILLTIHQDCKRTIRTFEEIDSYAQYYLIKFNDRISALKPKEKKRVITVISLERFRIALFKKKYRAGFFILKNNHVSLYYLLRYLIYLLYRGISKKSYGFSD